MFTAEQWLRLVTEQSIRPSEYHPLLAYHNLHGRLPSDLNASLMRRIEALDRPIPGHVSEKLDRVSEWAAVDNARVLTLADKQYPLLLRQIPDPPPVLFCQGDLALLKRDSIAIVGTRWPSAVAEEDAWLFAREFSARGLAVVSGLARGIDAAAHGGALEDCGGSVAVLGNGPDRSYPPENRGLQERLAAEGLVVSELLPGTGPRAFQFPRRNRIIAGLSRGVLVIEAGVKSGSLITARLACDYQREVFAIPGSIHNPAVRGSHALIRQGARLVETVEDVFDELAGVLGDPGLQTGRPEDQIGHASRRQVSGRSDVLQTEMFGDPLNCEANGQARPREQSGEQYYPGDDPADILQAVDWHPTPLEQVVQRVGMRAEEVLPRVMALVLQGALRETSEGYSRTGS